VEVIGMRHLIPEAGGFSLLEVLITIVVIAIGLLGLAGLQTRLQVSEMEAYQRSQALMLLQDMADRVAANRANAADYVAFSPLGTGDSQDTNCAGLSGAALDACEWSNSLKGAGETVDGSNVGAMVGGRGCIQVVALDEYLITVAWQGLTPISAPPSSVDCGAGLYGAADTPCANDLCRRVVTTIVRIGSLL
jgi:type IV pilus assembly protein PilV